MNEAQAKTDFEKYLASLPEDVADVVRQFLPGQPVVVENELFYVIGISEDRSGGGHHNVLLCQTDPAKDYKAAVNGELVGFCVKCIHDNHKITWHDVQ